MTPAFLMQMDAGHVRVNSKLFFELFFDFITISPPLPMVMCWGASLCRACHIMTSCRQLSRCSWSVPRHQAIYQSQPPWQDADRLQASSMQALLQAVPSSPLPFGLFALLVGEIQRGGVNTIAFAGRLRAVREDMSQVRIATATADLNTLHAV